MKKIEWFEEDGCLGGERGLIVDLYDKKIEKWGGRIEKISENNINDVKWCLEMNINYIKNRITKIENKIHQNSTIYNKIDGGYTISEPLNKPQKIKFKLKQNELINSLTELQSIKLSDLLNKK